MFKILVQPLRSFLHFTLLDTCIRPYQVHISQVQVCTCTTRAKSKSTLSTWVWHGTFPKTKKTNKMDEHESESSTITLSDTDTIVCLLAVALVIIVVIVVLITIHRKSKRIRSAALALQQYNERASKKKRKICPEKRKRVISKLIETRTITKEGGGCEECQTTSTSSSTNTNTNTSSVQNVDPNISCRIANVMISDDNNGCSICLETFEEGQDLSWSQERKCHHTFHAKCLEPWLMKHDDCPCCRTTFIDESTLLEDDEDGVIVVSKSGASSGRGSDENV